jgi:hypothetical protein
LSKHGVRVLLRNDSNSSVNDLPVDL